MTATIVGIFLVVYLGMILGGLPFLQLDRTGVALLGAIALISVDAVSLGAAAGSIHLPTIILLFSFMVVSAQMRLGGFYDWATHRFASWSYRPAGLLAALMLGVATLSAVFSNDIVCLAVTPVLIEACQRRRLDPVPYLLGLACSANIGSAATLIGNPQNMLIGQTLRLPFSGYIAEAAIPVGLGLLAAWAMIVWQVRGRWTWSAPAPVASAGAIDSGSNVSLDRWQTAKGLMVAAVLLIAFLVGPWPREHVALIGAGVLLLSRKMHSTRTLGLVDWELLVLFMALFVVNHAIQQSGVASKVIGDLAGAGLHLDQLAPLFGATFVLSNVVSNVPAVMLLLPLAHHEIAGPLLALVSSLSGNLLIAGSISNIIVVDAAARRDIRIDWRRHATIGIPVTLATLAIAAIYLIVRVRFLASGA
ncbi:putative membrane anion transport protein [Paraburkholderia piptadeniae]|uniref:Membrane anion transport protein n=1 Tax=Paraburkholderia piptadeniae TaxID=1701573 RepID=A0A1N7SV98_9BURK|nr:anion transporter [Paraburkholderia piptadeniae]SIT51381.1 putative membrane anion transport protein [Paraburkholderia piptadeniae]